MRYILDKGWGIGVVLPLGHALSEEPGDGVASGVVVFECGFKLHNKVGEGSDGDDSTRYSILSEGGCPGEGVSFGHICQRRDFPPTATQPNAGSGKEIPEGRRERARGEVAGFRNSESGALS